VQRMDGQDFEKPCLLQGLRCQLTRAMESCACPDDPGRCMFFASRRDIVEARQLLCGACTEMVSRAAAEGGCTKMWTEGLASASGAEAPGCWSPLVLEGGLERGRRTSAGAGCPC